MESNIDMIQVESIAESKSQPTRICHTIYAPGDTISGGTTGVVVSLRDGTALKVPWPFNEDENRKDLAHEYEVYQKIGSHRRFPKVLGHSDKGLHMTYYANGTLKDYLQGHLAVSLDQRRQWAKHAAEAVKLIHEHGIIHCDLRPANFIVDDDLELRLIDFAGSTDGTNPRHGSAEPDRYYLPRVTEPSSSKKTDLFALTCTVYFIMHGKDPLSDVPEDEVGSRYENHQFPHLTGSPYQAFLEKGFHCGFDSAASMNEWLERLGPYEETKEG